MSNKSSGSKSAKGIKSVQFADDNGELFLEQLDKGVSGTIVVMVCRIWDVNATTGRYLSTDFVVCDAKGKAIHCTARSNIAHNFVSLKEGSVYSIKNFIVQPNKDEYRIRRQDPFMLEFDGSTRIRKVSAKSEGFIRYPFELADLDDIEPYSILANVAGYVTNVGRTTHQKNGSRTLDFFLANKRFRLELDVSDHTAQTVVVLFDETVRELLKCSPESLLEIDPEVDEGLNLPPAITALIGTSHIFELKSHTYYEHGTFESFTCWKITQPHGALTCSSTPQTETGSSGSSSPLMKRLSKKRLSNDPTVSTPLNLCFYCSVEYEDSEPELEDGEELEDAEEAWTGDELYFYCSVDYEDSEPELEDGEEAWTGPSYFSRYIETAPAIQHQIKS